LVFLQVIDPDSEIAQTGHHLGASVFGDATPIFIETNVAPMVDSVLDRCPMSSYQFHEFFVRAFPAA